MCKLCLACLLNFTEQASWAELTRRGDLSDQKTKEGAFIRVEKLSLWESAVKIRDVVGTPNVKCLLSASTWQEIEHFAWNIVKVG